MGFSWAHQIQPETNVYSWYRGFQYPKYTLIQLEGSNKVENIQAKLADMDLKNLRFRIKVDIVDTHEQSSWYFKTQAFARPKAAVNMTLQESNITPLHSPTCSVRGTLPFGFLQNLILMGYNVVNQKLNS